MKHSRWVVVGALGASGLTLTGCEQDNLCTQMGCPYPVSIEVSAPAWPAGLYAFDFSDAEREYFCTLDLTTGGQGAGGAAGERQGLTQFDFELPCELVSGPAAEDWERPELWFDKTLLIDLKSAPAQLPLRVSYQNREVLKQQLTPSYKDSYPNGPDCGVCRSAKVAVSLPELTNSESEP